LREIEISRSAYLVPPRTEELSPLKKILHCVQNDNFCHPEQSEGSSWVIIPNAN
jgi:hypothetical protein